MKSPNFFFYDYIQQPKAMRDCNSIASGKMRTLLSLAILQQENIHFFSFYNTTNKELLVGAVTMATPAKWGAADDEKLFALFRKGSRNGGCSSTDYSKQNIEAIRQRHFPERTYRNFAVQYRKKGSQFNINQAVTGGKKSWQSKKQLAVIAFVSCFLTHSFSSFHFGSARKKGEKKSKRKSASDTESASEEEDDDDEQEDDFKEVDTKPPAQEKSSNHSFEDHTGNLSDKLSKMTVSNSNPFDLQVKFPYLMYTYKEDDRDRVTYDFLVVAQGQQLYRPSVPEGGTELHVGMVLPKFFIDRTRLLDAKAGDQSFTANTHKVTAFTDLVAKVEKSVGIDDDNRDSEAFEFLAAPMKLKTPFPVEEEILEWEMQAFQSNDEEFTDACAGIQYHFILTVTLQSVVKKKAKKAGGFRVIASPTRMDGVEETKDEWLQDDSSQGTAAVIFGSDNDTDSFWGNVFDLHDSTKPMGDAYWVEGIRFVFANYNRLQPLHIRIKIVHHGAFD